jgi:hypothetical protein
MPQRADDTVFLKPKWITFLTPGARLKNEKRPFLLRTKNFSTTQNNRLTGKAPYKSANHRFLGGGRWFDKDGDRLDGLAAAHGGPGTLFGNPKEEAPARDRAASAESFFSRMRRAEIGHHHHLAGPYLIRFAQEASWREDHRRESNGFQVDRVTTLAMRNPPSVDFCGYWQRGRQTA